MKLNKDFIKGIFENGNFNFSDITKQTKNLSFVTSQSSDFLNTLSLSKLTVNLRNSSELSSNVLNKIINLWDILIDSNVCEYDNNYTLHYKSDVDIDDYLYYHDIITSFFDELSNYLQADQQWVDIGHITGKPMYCMIHKSNGDNPTYTLSIANQEYLDDGPHGMQSLIWSYYYEDGYYKLNLINNAVNQLNNYWDESNIKYDDSELFMVYESYYDQYYNTFYNVLNIYDFETVSTECLNTNDCFTNIIKQATTDGHITAENVRSICATYGNTDGIRALIDNIAGCGDLQSVSIITLIGKVLSQIDAIYTPDSGNNYFTVHETPQFIKSILQTIASLIISAVAVILSVVFKAIAAVISFAFSLISSLFSKFRENVADTVANVTDNTLFPLFNYPLATAQVDLSKLKTQSAIEVFNKIDSTIREFGCAMILKTVTGTNPFAIWLIPSGTYNGDSDCTVMAQVLVGCNNPYFDTYGHMLDPRTDGPAMTLNSPYWVWTRQSVSAYYNDCYFPYPQVNTDSSAYMSYTDEQLRKACFNNICCFLADSIYGTYCLSETDQVIALGFDPNNTVDVWNINTFIDNWESWVCNSTNDPIDIDNDGGDLGVKGFTLLLYVLLYKNEYYQGSGVAPSWDLIIKIMNAINAACQHYNFIQAYWFTPEATKFDTGTTPYDTDYSKYGNNWKLSDFTTIESGVECSRTAVNLPNLSRNSLITSMIITAVGLATVAIGVAVGRKVAKRVATKNLMLKEKKFEDAKAAFLQDPTNKDLARQATRANKKLTRAWKIADKLGLSTYNGFSTGTDAAYAGNGTVSTLFSSDSPISQDINGTNLQTLISLIMG